MRPSFGERCKPMPLPTWPLKGPRMMSCPHMPQLRHRAARCEKIKTFTRRTSLAFPAKFNSPNLRAARPSSDHLMRNRLRSASPRRKSSIPPRSDCATPTICARFERPAIISGVMISRLMGRNEKIFAKLKATAPALVRCVPLNTGVPAKTK